MVKLAVWLKRHRFLLSVLAGYFIIGIGLLGWYRHQLNPDAVSYISIAKQYAAGNFHQALNAYWGPLLSWLLIPFALLHLSMQTGAKLVALVAGGLIITLVWLLAGQYKVEPRIRKLLLLVIAPFCWYWALPSPITPDILVVVAFLAYIYMLGLGFKQPLAKPALIGVIGALGFFAKAFFLPFFIVHLIIWTWLRIKDQPPAKNRPAWRGLGLSLVVAAVLLLPWALALHSKYHEFTLSSSGSYNIDTLSPTSPGQPVSNLGLLPPSGPGALSVWQDPTLIPVKSWSPFQSLRDFHYYLGAVVENMRVIGLIFLTFSVFSLATLAWSLIQLLNGKDGARRQQMALLLSAVIVYVIGYALTIREERYFWPIFCVTLLLAAIGASNYSKHKWQRPALLLAGLLVIGSFLLVPITKLNSQRNIDTGTKQSADSLRSYLKTYSRIASNNFDSMRYCYYWQLPCYGAINPALGNKFAEQQLKQYKITDFLVEGVGVGWQKPAYLSNYHEQPTGDPAVKLYILN